MSRNRLLAFVFFILLIIFLPGYSKLQELKAKNKLLATQIEELKKDNTRLINEVNKLQEDPLYIEKTAREKMGVSKKGEIIYKVVDSSKEPNE